MQTFLWKKITKRGTLMPTPIQLLKQTRNNLSKTNQKIADYIINNSGEVADLRIDELATKTTTSTASVSRLIKFLGYNSYREFTVALAYNQAKVKQEASFEDINNSDSLSTIADKIFENSQRALQDTRSGIEEEQFAEVVNQIIAKKRLFFFGLGGSSVAALSGYHKFLRTTVHCCYYPDYDVQLMQVAKSSADDCAIVISHSGENSESLKLVDYLKRNGAFVIGITSNPFSTLAKVSDAYFVSSSDGANYRSEGMYSLISQMLIIDTLFMMTAVNLGSDSDKLLKQINSAINSTRISE